MLKQTRKIEARRLITLGSCSRAFQHLMKGILGGVLGVFAVAEHENERAEELVLQFVEGVN